MYLGIHVKSPIRLSDFIKIWNFSTGFRKKSPVPNFVQVRPMEATLTRADRQTDRQKIWGRRQVLFANYVEVPKTDWVKSFRIYHFFHLTGIREIRIICRILTVMLHGPTQLVLTGRLLERFWILHKNTLFRLKFQIINFSDLCKTRSKQRFRFMDSLHKKRSDRRPRNRFQRHILCRNESSTSCYVDGLWDIYCRCLSKLRDVTWKFARLLK